MIAALLGVPVAVAAAGFMSLSYGLTTLVWTTIPDGAGWTAPPWWYVLAVPAMAGLLVAVAGLSALARRLSVPYPIVLVIGCRP